MNSCLGDSCFASCFFASCFFASCFAACCFVSFLTGSCFCDFSPAGPGFCACFGAACLACFSGACFDGTCDCFGAAAAPSPRHTRATHTMAPAKPVAPPNPELRANPRQARMQTNAPKPRWFRRARLSQCEMAERRRDGNAMPDRGRLQVFAPRLVRSPANLSFELHWTLSTIFDRVTRSSRPLRSSGPRTSTCDRRGVPGLAGQRASSPSQSVMWRK